MFDKVVNKDLKAVLNLNIVLLYITVFLNRCQVKKNMLYCNFTLRKKGEEQNPSSLQLNAPGRGGTSPREQSHVNCGGWSPSVYPFYSEQCMTPYQPQSICTGGGGGRTHCAGCVAGKGQWRIFCQGVRSH